MVQTIIELTNVRELGNPETGFNGEYQATLPNGSSPSGIAEGNKRLWPSIQAHLDAEKPIEKYVVHVDTPAELAAKELAELDETMPRFIEDLLDIMPVDQKTAYLAMDTKLEGKDKAWVKARKEELRGQL